MERISEETCFQLWRKKFIYISNFTLDKTGGGAFNESRAVCSFSLRSHQPSVQLQHQRGPPHQLFSPLLPLLRLPHCVFLAQRSAVLLYSPGSRSSHSHLRLIGSFWSTKNSDLRPRGAANLAGAAEPRNCRGKGKLFITRRAFHFALGVSGPEAEA